MKSHNALGEHKMLVKTSVKRISRAINFGSSFVSRNSIKFLHGIKFAWEHQGKLKMMMTELYSMQIWLYLMWNSYENKETDTDLGLLDRFSFPLQITDGKIEGKCSDLNLEASTSPFTTSFSTQRMALSHSYTDFKPPNLEGKKKTCISPRVLFSSREVIRPERDHWSHLPVPSFAL